MPQTVKNLPAVHKTPVRSLGQEDPLEEGMATHSSTLPGEFHRQRNLAAMVHGVTKSRTQPTLSLSMMTGKDKIIVSSKSVVLNLFGTRDRFRERRFVHGVGWGGRGWMVQAMM